MIKLGKPRGAVGPLKGHRAHLLFFHSCNMLFLFLLEHVLVLAGVIEGKSLSPWVHQRLLHIAAGHEASARMLQTMCQHDTLVGCPLMLSTSFDHQSKACVGTATVAATQKEPLHCRKEPMCCSWSSFENCCHWVVLALILVLLALDCWQEECHSGPLHFAQTDSYLVVYLVSCLVSHPVSCLSARCSKSLSIYLFIF